MDKKIKFTDYFADVETTKEYNGYFYSVKEALTIDVLGSFCGLQNVNKLHLWACNSRVQKFLFEHFGIEKIPCYYWLTVLFKLIKPESFNKCFINWIKSKISAIQAKNLTVSLDGKTICSTAKMEKYKNAMHIVSAQIAELGITFGQQTVDSKSNEIPAVRELIEMLEIKGCMIVADALNCQKETAQTIIDAKADYLLSVKDNQPTLKEEIAEVIHNEKLQKKMDTCKKTEKNRGRNESRTAFIFNNLKLIPASKDWVKLVCVGAINTQFTKDGETSNEWHYYISSRKLTAEKLLYHARLEWSVETMHWLLDVHYDEDSCRVQDKNTLQNLNMFRKIALNEMKLFTERTGSKKPISNIMFECLLEPNNILNVLIQN